MIDPLVLDRSLDRFRKGKRKLGDLCVHYGVTDGGNLHTADVDVLATLDVLEAMTRVFPELAEQDLDSLHRHQITAHRAWAENFNTWRTGQGYVGAGASTAWPS